MDMKKKDIILCVTFALLLAGALPVFAKKLVF